MINDIKSQPQSMIEAARAIHEETKRRETLKEQLLRHYGVDAERALPHERLATFKRDFDRAITEGNLTFLEGKEIDIQIKDDKDDDKDDDKKDFAKKDDDAEAKDDGDSDSDKKKAFFKKLKEARYCYTPQETGALKQQGNKGTEAQKSLKKISGKDVSPPYITKSKTKEVNPFGKFVKEEFHGELDFLVSKK